MQGQNTDQVQGSDGSVHVTNSKCLSKQHESAWLSQMEDSGKDTGSGATPPLAAMALASCATDFALDDRASIGLGATADLACER